MPIKKSVKTVFEGRELSPHHKQILLGYLQRLMTPAKLSALNLEPDSMMSYSQKLEVINLKNVFAHLGAARYKLSLIQKIEDLITHGFSGFTYISFQITEVAELKETYQNEIKTLLKVVAAVECEGLKRKATTGCLH